MTTDHFCHATGSILGSIWSPDLQSVSFFEGTLSVFYGMTVSVAAFQFEDFSIEQAVWFIIRQVLET